MSKFFGKNDVSSSEEEDSSSEEKEEKKDNDAKEDGGKKRRLAEEEYKRLFRKGERPPVTWRQQRQHLSRVYDDRENFTTSRV